MTGRNLALSVRAHAAMEYCLIRTQSSHYRHRCNHVFSARSVDILLNEYRAFFFAFILWEILFLIWVVYRGIPVYF